MKKFLLLFLSLTLASAQAQDLQSPAEFLGYELGTKFTPHHRVMDYFEHVAQAEPARVQLKQYGETYEGRPLVIATLSTSENMRNLEAIRSEHLKSLEGSGQADKAVVWLSYNVHGNESVSTEASMETIYLLLTEKSNYLDNTVVHIDPCINPDGRDRYVNFYKQFRNTPYNVDPNSKEHHEGWLSGRANHYMFDLNRDWAWLTQVESQQRLKAYNRWMPHIHVDFHEQGVDAPYYFAPAAEPYHEVITPFQRDFQGTIGKNHARYFDANGWFYFTREVFDLFYPSYGDTYPTYNGAIGMTYEQGGSGRAGLAVLNSNGDTLSLKDRIAHHRTTGLSTVEVAASNHTQLNEEFRKFYGQSKPYENKTYVLNGNDDQIAALAQLLQAHEIEFGQGRSGSIRGFNYRTGSSGNQTVSSKSLVVPGNQTKSTLVKVLFEPDAKLVDSLTYDITAWSLPYAYGLEAMVTESRIAMDTYSPDASTSSAITAGAYAYLGDWNSMKDARFLSSILQQGIRVRRALAPFDLEGNQWERGTLIITRSDNARVENFEAILSAAVQEHEKPLTSVSTGLVNGGKDFGSRYVQMIPDTKIAVLTGDPTSTLRFGEVWHFFEQQLKYPVSVLDASYIDRVSLDDYDVLILPDGWGYRGFLNEGRKKAMVEWVRKGGRLIAMGGSLSALGGEGGFGISATEGSPNDGDPLQSFEASRRDRISSAITGAIFKAKVDPTHPLAFGYGSDYFTLKVNGGGFAYLKGGSNVVTLGKSPKPVAGFAGSRALTQLPESLIFGMEYSGRGSVVYFADNPLFRGFWEGGKLFFANALFMVD
ncbi:Zinc carboxypeptidase [Robiginitalea myxolifaciens]|uniref:Zinc carboxypeptidase n=1 Tax=Robiginitalea myxolifaciens TaxID=400055 RepID=A0A1I6H584_9FLAO|nr:M14 family zinc carboxypeptidase [Robiginitalea myxolifaciens]SFR49564.1 Zinc carboxypeptidase [Robiginitalea myxolifaciens]